MTDDARRGLMHDKLKPIEASAQLRLEDNKVAKEGSDHWHRLNETEETLKFGLFMLTFMYFRAMAFLARLLLLLLLLFLYYYCALYDDDDDNDDDVNIRAVLIAN